MGGFTEVFDQVKVVSKEVAKAAEMAVAATTKAAEAAIAATKRTWVDQQCSCDCVPRETINEVLAEVKAAQGTYTASVSYFFDEFNSFLEKKLSAGSRCKCEVPSQKQ